MIKRLNTSLFEIERDDYLEILNNKKPHILIDIRKAEEIETQKCNNSLYPFRKIIYIEKDRIEKITLEKELTKCPFYKDNKTPIIILCRRGNRSLETAFILNKMNILNVKSLNCGINGLEN